MLFLKFWTVLVPSRLLRWIFLVMSALVLLAACSGNSSDGPDCPAGQLSHGGECVSVCASQLDCRSGSVCDAALGACVVSSTDIDECELGLDTCDDDASCTNTVGSYVCQCNEGYAGDGEACVDIDECTENEDICSANADCTNTPGGYTCACSRGYELGDNDTCEAIDPARGFDPVSGDSAKHLINGLYGTSAPDAVFFQGTFDAETNSVTAAGDVSTGYEIVLALARNAGSTSGVTSTIVVSSSRPVTELKAVVINSDNNEVSYAADIWDSTAWVSSGSAGMDDANPYESRYHYRLAMNDATIVHDRSLLIKSAEEFDVRFFTKDVTPLSVGPTAYLEMISADGVAEYINKLYNTDRPTAQFQPSGGSFFPPATVKLTGIEGGATAVFALNPTENTQTMGVTNTIVARANHPISVWSWFRTGFVPIDGGQKWNGAGWALITAEAGPATATEVDGYYYYRINVNNEEIEDRQLAIITTRSPEPDRGYTLTLYRRCGSGQECPSLSP